MLCSKEFTFENIFIKLILLSKSINPLSSIKTFILIIIISKYLYISSILGMKLLTSTMNLN